MADTAKVKPLFGVPRLNSNLISASTSVSNLAPLPQIVIQAAQTKPESNNGTLSSKKSPEVEGNVAPLRVGAFPCKLNPGVSKGKAKKLKDPMAPKKPANSFMLFCKEERSRVVEILGTKVPGPVAVELSKRWAGLGEEERGKWDQAAKDEKLLYEKAVENYCPSEDFLKAKSAHDRMQTVSMKCAIDEDPSIEMMVPYFEYMSSNWQKVATLKPGMTIPEVQQEILNQWTKTAETVKSGSKKKKVKDPNAPKRPMSAYFLFVKEMRGGIAQENPALKNTEILSELGRKWRNMDESSREPYVKEAKKKSEEYFLEMKKYKDSL